MTPERRAELLASVERKRQEARDLARLQAEWLIAHHAAPQFWITYEEAQALYGRP